MINFKSNINSEAAIKECCELLTKIEKVDSKDLKELQKNVIIFFNLVCNNKSFYSDLENIVLDDRELIVNFVNEKGERTSSLDLTDREGEENRKRDFKEKTIEKIKITLNFFEKKMVLEEKNSIYIKKELGLIKKELKTIKSLLLKNGN